MKLVETQHIDEKDIHVKQGKEAISCNITIRKNVMRNFCFTFTAACYLRIVCGNASYHVACYLLIDCEKSSNTIITGICDYIIDVFENFSLKYTNEPLN